MTDHPFIQNLDRDEFSDLGYAIIGRAISVCTQFEQDVNVLRTYIEFKKDPVRLSINEINIADVSEKIWKMNLGQKIKSSMVPEEMEAVLTKAKNARNFLVHELTIGIQNDIHTEKGRRFLVETMEEKVRDLINGWYYVLAVHTLANKQSGIPPADQFVKSTLNWILEPE
jgi:hypothetical protein